MTFKISWSERPPWKSLTEGESSPTRWKRFRRRWELHLRVVDPVVGTIIGLVLAWWLVLENPTWATSFALSKSTTLFTAGSAVTGVLLGLTLAALTIIADHLAGRALVAKSQGYQLVDVFIAATAALGSATVVALIGLAPTGATALKVLMAVWVVATTISIVLVMRSISLLRAIIRAIIDRGQVG